MVRRERRNVMRRISMTTRKELVQALQERYRSAAFSERIKILDEFVALTGYHRKHAIRVLRQEVGTGVVQTRVPLSRAISRINRPVRA